MQNDASLDTNPTKQVILLYSIEALFCLIILTIILFAEQDATANSVRLSLLAAGLVCLRFGIPRLFRWTSLYRVHFYDGVAAAAAIGLIARLIFILVFSKTPVVWDAALYWQTARSVHDAICSSLHICAALSVETLTTTGSDILQQIFMTRVGLFPAILGLLITLAPAKPATGLVVNAVLDSLVILLTVWIILRLNGPRWVALAAALIQASYIPTILIDGAIRQQPFILFFETLCLWGYIYAFTSSTTRARVLGCAIGSLGAFLTGYASITTRPLMWVLMGLVPVLAVVIARYRPLLKIQLACMAVVGVIITGICLLLIGSNSDIRVRDVVSTMLTGLSSSGGAAAESTPVSFPYFWGDSTARRLGVSTTTSLAGDFKQDPVKFARLLSYSIVCNWRYPGNVYFQQFILGQDLLRAEHTIWLLLGLVGLLWFIGQREWQYAPYVLILAAYAYSSVVDSVISVEPRRNLAVTPIVSIGAAYSLWMAIRYHKRIRPWVAALVGAAIVAWLLPFPMFLQILPVGASTAFSILFGLRFLLVSALAVALIVFLKRAEPGYSPVLPGLFLAPTLLIAIIGFGQEPDWQNWSAPLARTFRQEVYQITPRPNTYPWLLVDAGSPEQAASLAIRVNGNLIKPSGTQMLEWRAGVPSMWSAFYRMDKIQTMEVKQHLWLAVPLPANVLAQGRLTIDLEPGQEPVRVYGSYPASPVIPYAGPLLSPWYDGNSFRLWTWNWTDGRIPWPQTLNGQYHSSYFDGQVWQSGDLSPEPGMQSGLYRVFVAQEVFGPNTNALISKADKKIFRCPADPAEPEAIPPANGLPAICKHKNEARLTVVDIYDPAGRFLGTSTPRKYNQGAAYGDVVDSFGSADGKVVVLKGFAGMHVANIYTPDDQLSYSLAF